jgi:hydrogenase nickel incorporation protein HypA/HybF
LHEFSIAEDMIRLIERTLGSRKDLLTVTLTVGPLSGISPESLRFCFSEIAGQRGFGSPELLVNITLAAIRCRSCGLEYETSDFQVGCPSCSSVEMDILSGRECTLESVEIEEDDGG